MLVLTSPLLLDLLVIPFALVLRFSTAEYSNPPPRWTCPFDARKGPSWTIFDYYGVATRSGADTLCAPPPRSQLIAVNDLENPCLKGFISANDPDNTYAVADVTHGRCHKPCNTTGHCLRSCPLQQPVLVICKVIFWVNPKAVLKDCGSFDNPAFGRVDYPNGYRYWSFLRYQCSEGYVLTDSRPVFCEHDGQWMTFKKTLGVGLAIPARTNMCRRLALCSTVKSIPSGFLYITNNSVHAEARAMCTEGFSFDGDPNARCGDDGRWSNPNGSCQALCPSVQYIPNGYINITSNKVYAIAEAICFERFKFTADPTVRCQITGVWSSPNGSCDGDMPEKPEQTKSSWISSPYSKVTTAVTVILVCLVVALLVTLFALARMRRSCEVKGCSSDDLETTAICRNRRVIAHHGQGYEATTDDLQGRGIAPRGPTLGDEDQYDHLNSGSKQSPKMGATPSQPTGKAAKPSESDLLVGTYSAITLETHGSGHQTTNPDKSSMTPSGGPCSGGAYSMVDLSSKKSRPFQDKNVAELTEAVEEIADLLDKPSVPPKLKASV